MKLEVACFNLESVAVVAQSNADRVEFCDEFNAGGTTPSIDSTLKARLLFSKELLVMIRQRGGDFNYSEAEFNAMKRSILELKNTGIDGFVFGILDENNNVDFQRNSELVALAKPLPCSFHRAIDYTGDYFEAINTCITIGFKTILTSGHQSKIEFGMEAVQEAIIRFGNPIQIMPGGSLRSSNASKVKAITKATYYHTSAITDATEIANLTEINALKDCLSNA
ncbi:copper homeostasis protein CutC [Flavobacterium sp.]|jgi:copper homeostasis protein|uniref:copper homeostasis protein CutC n=1 Tax=Flavobacterium sp. TaxID=239 RepID=UPI0037BE60EA